MRRRIAIVVVAVAILSALLFGRRFFVPHISDRNLLIEAVQDKERATPPPERYVFWDVFCQQAAQGYYDDAMATILLSHHDSDIQYALVTLAKIRARNGDIAGALRAARAYSNPDTRERAIREIAVAQAERGDLRGAQQTTSLLSDPRPALEAIAVTEADKGDLQDARDTISSLPKPDQALQAIGEYQIKAGDFEGALKTAEQMSSNSTANLLLDIGFELRRRGEQGRIHELASGITTRELARLFTYYARLAQWTMEHPNKVVVVADACAQADSDATKGDFPAAYTLMAHSKCMYSFVAIKQYPSDPAFAERALLQSQDQMDVCFGLSDFSKKAAASGDIADAVRLVDEGQKICGAKYGYLTGAVREVARTWTIREGPRAVVTWARSRPSASQRALALLGVAEAMGHAHP